MARILAIDDERAILDTLARVLRRDGHEVEGAPDPMPVADPGFDLARFDLVLCDVMMPGLDGFELVRRIRPRFDGPILFLTAKVAEEDAVTGYGMGADDYIRKPFGAAELRAKVAAHLRRERRGHTSALRFGDVTVNLGSCEVLVRDGVCPSRRRNTRSASFLPAAPVRCSRASRSARGCSVGRARSTTPPSRCM